MSRFSIAGLVLALVLVIQRQGVAAELVLNGISVVVPAGYERIERSNSADEAVHFTRKGDGRSALAALLPQVRFSPSFLDDWFHDNTIARLSIEVRDRPQAWRPLSETELQREISDQWAAQWGRYSFTISIPEKNIHWLVNYAGAFVAVSIRSIEDKIVMVEAMDLAHVLAAEKTLSSAPDRSAETLWNFFRRAANADDAETVLSEIRIK